MVGVAANSQEAIAQVAALHPDVVLLDIRMPVMDGVAATRAICQNFPNVKVLVLSTFDTDKFVGQAMAFGAKGYLLKDTPSDDLAQAIRAVYKGYTHLGAGLFEKTLASSTPIVTSQPIESADSDHLEKLNALTPREREVFELIASGASNREIAERLYITERTVKNHVSNILSRLNLRDRTQAAILAHSSQQP